jgi:hypothetical protein
VYLDAAEERSDCQVHSAIERQAETGPEQGHILHTGQSLASAHSENIY